MYKKQFLNIVLSLALGLVIIYIAVMRFEPYSLIWLLPFTYMLVYIVFWRFKKNEPMFSSMGDILFKTAVTIRYLILPILIVTNSNSHYGFGSYIGVENYSDGILFMSYELIFVSVLYYLLGKITNKTVKVKFSNLISNRNDTYIYKIVIMVGMVFLVFPEVRNRYTFFASDIIKTSREIVSSYNSNYNTLFYFTNYAKIAIPIVILVYFHKKYLKKNKVKYVIFSIIGTMIPNLFYVATSRNSILFPMLAAFFTMLLIFRSHRKLIYLIYGLGITAIISVMTLSKSLSGNANITFDWLVNYFSIYFLGPKEYAIGITAVQTYGGNTTIYTLINDIIGNIPGLSKFADLLDRTTQFFNWTYYGGSHIGIGGGYIVPSSIQGAFHFGYLFGPIMLIIPIFTTKYSEYLINKKPLNISRVYIANYAISASTLFYSNSVSSLLNLLFFIILPMYLINIGQRLLFKK